MTRIKICGLRRVDDALVAAEAGADLLGFVFAPSRRRIEPETARAIITEVRHHREVQMVGVFVNASADGMNRIGELCGLDYLQLSGDEDAALVSTLERPVIKTIHVSPSMTPTDVRQWIDRFPTAVIHLDTASAGAYGGTGATFDWSLVPHIDRRILLAGGLQQDNVRTAISLLRPWGVDVSSGVETTGEKDGDKIRRFIQAARRM